jgi:hypothetical protein
MNPGTHSIPFSVGFINILDDSGVPLLVKGIRNFAIV